MTKKQAGFTLIELVVVLVLLGIIGAVATARFQDLSGDARAAAQQGIAAEIQSASAINYAAGVIQDPVAFLVAVTGAVNCDVAAAGLLTSGAIPTGWTVNAAAIAGCGTPGAITTNCTIIDSGATLVALPVTMICTG